MTSLSVFGYKVIAAEEAHHHAGAGRRIGLLALHGVENRFPRVCSGPYNGKPTRRLLPAVDIELRIWCFNDNVFPAMGLGLDPGMLAEEIVLFRS